jgi:hypothetical protein
VELKFVDVQLWPADSRTFNDTDWIKQWLIGYWPPKV